MPVKVTPRHSDLAAICAETVVADFAGELPDLRRAVIIVPDELLRLRPQLAELRRHLLRCARDRGCETLIPPRISTLWRVFLERRRHTASAPSERREKLLFADVLRKHRKLFPHGSPWGIADELLALFDQISERDVADNAGGESLKRGFDYLEEPAWSKEKKMLMALWRAWGELPGSDDLRAAWRRELLAGGVVGDDEQVYLCGFDTLTPCRLLWAKQLYRARRLTVLARTGSGAATPCPPDPVTAMIAAVTEAPAVPPAADTPRARALDLVFSTGDAPLALRAKQLAHEFPQSPLAPQLRVFRPDKIEGHAWGICLAVLQWLREGREKIGIVSPDRRLSRRLRAVFERHGITLQDYSGWELSTTSSAAVISQLLPDNGDGDRNTFGADALLTLLSSPYCDHGLARTQLADTRRQIEDALSRLEYPPATPRDVVTALQHRDGAARSLAVARRIAEILDRFERLAAPAGCPFADYFDGLFAAMEALGIVARFAHDPAGGKLLQELREMHDAARWTETCGSFREWRGWLRHNFEQANFIPEPPEKGILLMNLRQARLSKFDALALVSLDSRHLPSPPRSALMNENLRRELGLETREQENAVQFHLFRTLFESADAVLLSCQREAGGRALMPSPWLDSLQSFHRLAYGDDLGDGTLAAKARRGPECMAGAGCGEAVSEQRMPTPAAPADLWPQRLSASAHQALINCPYRFFARHCLGIVARDEVDIYWNKAQYGRQLHHCLCTLHQQADELHGPAEWSEENRESMLQLARDVVDAEFEKAVAVSHANNYWRGEARNAIAHYVDWMTEVHAETPVRSVEAEIKVEKTIADGLVIHGRLDHVAETKQGKRIVDYKTGVVPRNRKITDGEDVQLASYALLVEDAETALYLGLSARNGHQEVSLAADDLEDCRRHARARLTGMRRDFAGHCKLPAWGDPESACKYCEYEGLCRRPAWHGYPD